ncbi:hypothetical protein BTM25_01090 [Actinomadura rubteroloni]|uniref:Uncharacterized protein n=1 Tax=Actinomadura rubteroloni TaxID=1926885 RepID=A0A2P4UKZ5_9ACTN|nr:hypothetical protein BTM25_01090 [Actinomadura rubteroloni]
MANAIILVLACGLVAAALTLLVVRLNRLR